ncbi:hypothetical protein BJX76DRAFT_363949 [Aspergillus varians]
MSLHRTLLFFFSLSSLSFAHDQEVLQDSDRGVSGLGSSRGSVLVTKSVTYNEHNPLPTHVKDTPSAYTTPLDTLSCPSDEKQCNDSCIPSTQDCCSAAEHCFAGDYCYQHGGEVRCCPQGLACFQISGSVCFEQTLLLYEEVHIVEEGNNEVVTSWDQQASVHQTRTKITVTASYPAEGRSSYTRLSSRVAEAAATLIASSVATRTITLTSPTSPSFLSDSGPGAEGQVVLG